MAKKKQAKKQNPKTQTGILEKFDTKDLNMISSSCLIQELTMKRDLRWRLDLDVRTVLPKSFYKYNVKLVFDQQPFLERIKHLEEKIQQIDAEARLFKNDPEVKEIRKQIESIEWDIEEKEKNCPVVEFFGSVDTLQYKNNNTVLKLQIPDTVIDLLNKTKNWFNYYRLELRPLEDK